MDILDFAIQMELDGRAYYRNSADQAANLHVRQIFLTLADEEHRHYHVFKKLKGGEDASPADLAPRGKTVMTLKSIFREMIQEGREKLGGDTKREVWK